MKTHDPAWIASLKGASDSDKNWWIAFLTSVFLGFLGIDRIYLGSYGLGALKLVTTGGACFWWLIDILLLLSNKMHDAHGDIVRRPF